MTSDRERARGTSGEFQKTEKDFSEKLKMNNVMDSARGEEGNGIKATLTP